jgi:putative heme-binding domain-containing protein
MMERMLSIALGILFCFAFASLAFAQEQADVDAGAKLFSTACRVCHGEAGVGNRAPALRGPRLTHDYVRKMIIDGKAGTMMPKFGTSFTPRQVNQLASYIVTLQSSDSVWLALRGNPVAGEQVFFDREAAHSCYNCHSFQGKGRKVGPELTTKLKGKSAREVFQKIVIVPHRSADPAYVNVAIATRDGERVTGIKAEETDTELHFYDTTNLPPEVRTLPKSEIVSMKPLNGSAMPSDYASRLPLQKLLDLVAYLRTGVEGTPVTVSFEDVIQDRAPSRR